jgi:ubiquinone/menaquinone biosynthesis C-methylase UbiE
MSGRRRGYRRSVASVHQLENHMSSVEYHLEELRIALDETNANRVLPEILATDKAVLDIGCGVGQMFVALNMTGVCRCTGLDIDEEALRYGIEQHGDTINFILADAKRIPLPGAIFDLVVSRVALPYTNIPKVIKEIRRVLKPGGRVWLTLHEKNTADGYVADAWRDKNCKRLLHVYYILANGFLFKYFGWVLPYLNGRYESWQDAEAMRRLLSRHGFTVNISQVGCHTVLEGKLE